MQILWKHLKPLRGWLVLSLALAGVGQLLELVDPMILGRIIDQYALNPLGLPENELVKGALGWLLVAVAVALAARLARTFQDYFVQVVVQSAGKGLFNDGLRMTLRLSFQEYENSSSGEAVARLQKVRGDMERFISASVNILFSTVVGVGFLIWYAVTRSWLLIPVFLVGLVLLGGLTGLLSRTIRTTQRAIMRETARMYGVVTESLRNIELVKSLGLTRQEYRRLEGYTQRIMDLEIDKVKRVRSLSFLQGTVINVAKQSILFILLWLIFRKVLQPGQLVATQVIVNSMFGPLQQLGGYVLSYREAEASMQTFEQLMQLPAEQRPDEPVDIGPLESIRFEDVTFRYCTGSENAIDSISFRAGLGDTIAFAGPSGSGKSTLVKLLVGLYRPTGGTISVDEAPTDSLRFNQVRRQIGFVTQDPQLFSGTIRDNLLFIKPDATDEQMMSALQRAAATGILARSGQGLDTRIGEGGTRVSGGERQRLSIARALLRNPRLFIFDEATSALDSITEQEITRSNREISARKESIVILIAHRLSTLSYADRIYVLEKGRIVEQGSHQELLDRRGLYYAMWRQQVGERPRPEPAAEGIGPSQVSGYEWFGRGAPKEGSQYGGQR
jgi:ATP-binding cassette subfamily B protein